MRPEFDDHIQYRPTRKERSTDWAQAGPSSAPPRSRFEKVSKHVSRRTVAGQQPVYIVQIHKSGFDRVREFATQKSAEVWRDAQLEVWKKVRLCDQSKTIASR